LLYALMVAQGEHEFAHLDLHLKNILLQTLDTDQVLEYTVGSTKYRCASFMVKIADFGLSRITTDAGQVVYNDRQPLSDIFDNCKRKDIEMIEAHLLRIGRAAYERDAVAFGGPNAVPVDNDVSIDWLTLGRLRSRMRNGEPLAALLDDDFFDSLRADARRPLPASTPAGSGRRVSRSRTPTKNRKSLGSKTTAVVVEALAPTTVPALQRFAYAPRAAPKVSAPPATTTHRHRTRSVHKEEQEQKRCASEKTRGANLPTTEADENAPNDLGDIRKRLSFANAK
jgi:serine/threonine protein kinase